MAFICALRNAFSSFTLQRSYNMLYEAKVPPLCYAIEYCNIQKHYNMFGVWATISVELLLRQCSVFHYVNEAYLD